MKEPQIALPQSREDEVDEFTAVVPELVKDGAITRKQGEYGTGLDGVKDHLRPIAEQELKKQGK